MTTHILIVEDEPLIADDLGFHLRDMGIPSVDIALKYEDAINLLSTNSYDLVLLDINLSGEKDGVDLAHFIRSSTKNSFIFITSYYDQGTLERVKEVAPAAFIIKPFDAVDIQVNVSLALSKSSQTSSINKNQFFVKDGSKMIAVNANDIDFVEGFDNYSKVHIDENEYILSHTLKSVEEKLPPQMFVRIHKSYIINLTQITMIQEGHVFVKQKHLPIGRAFKKTFMDRISLL
ncbi:LytR/AlgR family response regulator transcription factor [Ekhidna sp.]|uniref:LytR/AlgR family response regulator transcription factor n=1 Tax=Ekhidna sp. TaxID=2608089 RepID=UPI0035153C33